ncbi:MAG: hypothetical protein HY812_20055 [Planctomycetes bacterium]|nr:hypothetical protein [Planctomycetota bacterium]
MASLVALAIAGYALAQDHPATEKKQPTGAKQPTTASVADSTVTGENICLGCALQHQKGAAAQCSKYGHRHALKVTSASASGEEHPEMEGWVLHYLDTDNAQSVIKEHHGETLTVKGKVYADERVLEVSKVEVSTQPEHPKTEHPKPEHPKQPEHPKK